MPLSREPRARGIYTDEVDQKGGYLAKVRDKEARDAAKEAASTAKADLEKYASETDERIGGAEARLDGAEDRLTDAEGRLSDAEGDLDDLDARIAGIWDRIYPVGSIYMSVNAASPATLFGGTWERIKDTFLLSAGDAYAAGATGGEAAHTLTSAESGLPSHTHPRVIGGEDGSTALFSARANLGSSSSAHWGSWFGGGYNGWNNVYVQAQAAQDASQAHNNMPPYLAVYVWKRMA